MDNWISVSDKLPTHNYSVLGHVISGGLVIGPDDSMVDIVCYLPEKKQWLQHVVDDDREVVVSHWMDLPNPPTL